MLGETAYNEKEIIALCKNDDLNAFGLLLKANEQSVYATCYHFMGNSEDAEDLAQETFLKAFRAIKMFRGDSSFKTWVLHIAANTCRDELRKKKKATIVSLDAPVQTQNGEMARQLSDNLAGPELDLEKKETQWVVQEAINELNYEYKEILVLREFQGLSYGEIAQILNCTEGTVKSRLSRARNALKKNIITKNGTNINELMSNTMKGGSEYEM
ncbi:MAG: sigma-70 family RNA polymerase sigma factor [Clostridia bacterium]